MIAHTTTVTNSTNKAMATQLPIPRLIHHLSIYPPLHGVLEPVDSASHRQINVRSEFVKVNEAGGC